MYATRIRPSAFNRFGQRYHHFIDFNHFLGRSALEDTWLSQNSPKVKNGKKSFKIEIPLPGFSKKDILVAVANNVLSVDICKDEKKLSSINQNELLELGKRYYHLPNFLDPSAIKVKYRNGILKISVPYKEGVPSTPQKIVID